MSNRSDPYVEPQWGDTPLLLIIGPHHDIIIDFFALRWNVRCVCGWNRWCESANDAARAADRHRHGEAIRQRGDFGLVR